MLVYVQLSRFLLSIFCAQIVVGRPVCHLRNSGATRPRSSPLLASFQSCGRALVQDAASPGIKVYSHSLHLQGWSAGLCINVTWFAGSICSSLLVEFVRAGINHDTCRRQFAVSIGYHLTCYKLQALSSTLAKSNAYSFHKTGLQPNMPSSAEVNSPCHRLIAHGKVTHMRTGVNHSPTYRDPCLALQGC